MYDCVLTKNHNINHCDLNQYVIVNININCHISWMFSQHKHAYILYKIFVSYNYDH